MMVAGVHFTGCDFGTLCKSEAYVMRTCKYHHRHLVRNGISSNSVHNATQIPTGNECQCKCRWVHPTK